MKKSIYFFVLLFCFIFEVFSLASPLKSESKVDKTSPIGEEEFKTFERRTVRVYIPETASVKTVDIEEYVTGVLIGEMYENAPPEALKAVAVAIRSYTLHMCDKNKNKEYDVTADPSVYQAYVSAEGRRTEAIKKAVAETENEVATYNGEIILALYHASSGEYTENCENVFIEPLSYLKGVENTEEESYEDLKEFDIDEFNSILERNSLPEFDFNTLEVEIKRNQNARCKTLVLKDKEKAVFIDGKKVRSIFSLRSTSLDVELGDSIEFICYGYGHGVGLSQNGAVSMAKKGKNYKEILKKYYSGVTISKTIYFS